MSKTKTQILIGKNIPFALTQTPEPPAQLYIKGTLPDTQKNHFLCVVGSRKHTAYGARICKQLILGLRGTNTVIVSGLALGIDAIAHASAITAQLPTVAIPGSGLDDNVLYPRTNYRLAEKIISEGGALISEYADTFRATSWSFPKRNRLMAGLSNSLLVVEAQRPSGSLITARLALDYNKNVGAVPGAIDSNYSRGTNFLIRAGAVPITSVDDLLDFIGAEKCANADQRPNENLTQNENVVLKFLDEPKSRESLLLQSKLSAIELNVAVSLLEIKQLISEELGLIRKM